MALFHDNKTRRILEKLQHNTRTAKEIFEAVFPRDPDTFKVTKRLLGYITPPKKLTLYELKRLEQKRFYTLLSKLRQEGLVKKRGVGKSAVWQSTAHGLQKLLRQPTQSKRHADLPQKIYPKKKIRDNILIIFDIPENLKHYRDWIRYQLRLLGFVMLQKSVWIGTYQIPVDFIYDLRECNVLRYIHIFRVIKTGSIID
jgi:hypothetical protein